MEPEEYSGGTGILVASADYGSADYRSADYSSTCSPAWLLLAQLGDALLRLKAFAVLFEALVDNSGKAETGRQRGIFPLGPPSPGEIASLALVADADVACATRFVSAVVVGLNSLYGVKPARVHLHRRSAAQQRALLEVVSTAADLATRLGSEASTRSRAMWHTYERGDATQLELRASKVDIPATAGTCDPATLVDEPLRSLITGAAAIFPDPVDGLDRFPGFYAGDRREYVALTVLQLRAGLLELRTQCSGGGTVFPVGKAGGKAQRVVWHGTRVSKAAARPPAPLHLASPAAFGLLDLACGRQLRVSKRDCRTWFDQLVLAPSLRGFCGRPRVLRTELLEAGVSPAELLKFTSDI